MNIPVLDYSLGNREVFEVLHGVVVLPLRRSYGDEVYRLDNEEGVDKVLDVVLIMPFGILEVMVLEPF